MSENTNYTTITTEIQEENVNENLMKLYVLGSTITQDIALLQLSDPHYDENGNIDENDDQVINILIDSGMGIDKENKMISEYLTKLNKDITDEKDKVKESDVRINKNHLEILHELGIEKIDYIYITHFHYDHVKGLNDIVEGYTNVKTGENYAGINVRNATIFLPENPPSAFYSEDYYINGVYDLIKEYNMTFVIPGGKAGKYNYNNTSKNYEFEWNDDLKNKTSFSIGKNKELILDFKNTSTHDYYFYKDESGTEHLRTEIFTETITASTDSFKPKKALIENGIKDDDGDSCDFKITINGETPYYTSVALDSDGNKKYPSITVPAEGSATIEYLGISTDYNDTCLCCIMTFGSNRIGFFWRY